MRKRIVVAAFCALATALVVGRAGNMMSAQAEPPPCDFTTGGGYIFPDASSNGKGTFGVAGGCKHGSGQGAPYWGHLQYHDMNLKVHWTSITGYQNDPLDPNVRFTCGTATTNFGEVEFLVRTKDSAAGPGTNDEFDIQLQGAGFFYTTFDGAPHKLGGGIRGGGNIELHKANNSNTGVFSVDCPAPPPPQDADVSVTKIASSPTVAVGEQASFNITVMANGPGASTNVTLVDVLPARPEGFEFTVTGEDAGSCTFTSETVNGFTQQTLTCMFGTMPAGDDRMITVTTTADRCGEGAGFTNTATVTADTDSNPSNNSSTASIQVPCPPE